MRHLVSYQDDCYRGVHAAVKKAIKEGKLKPKPCRDCGMTENVIAHHTDYSKPLKVVWLCKACHKKVHRMEGCVGKNNNAPSKMVSVKLPRALIFEIKKYSIKNNKFFGAVIEKALTEYFKTRLVKP